MNSAGNRRTGQSLDLEGNIYRNYELPLPFRRHRKKLKMFPRARQPLEDSSSSAQVLWSNSQTGVPSSESFSSKITDATYTPGTVATGSTFLPNGQGLSYETVGRQRHLVESRGALNVPPLTTFLCLLQIVLYFAVDNLGIDTEADIYVSHEILFENGEYWRLIVAPFVHLGWVSLLTSCGGLFTLGRYLERKIKWFALLPVIIAMSLIQQLLYVTMNPYLCTTPESAFTYGFGNVIYSLRILLAYCLEPRNREYDLVFGLYPMVVSASHAPWQPALDLLVMKLVLPEFCITGQLTGILAGFIVTAILLLFDFSGIYEATLPYSLSFMEPSESESAEMRHNEDRDRSQINTYSSSDIYIRGRSEMPQHIHRREDGTSAPGIDTNSDNNSPANDSELEDIYKFEKSIEWNPLKRKSDEWRKSRHELIASARKSLSKFKQCILGGSGTEEECTSFPEFYKDPPDYVKRKVDHKRRIVPSLRKELPAPIRKSHLEQALAELRAKKGGVNAY